MKTKQEAAESANRLKNGFRSTRRVREWLQTHSGSAQQIADALELGVDTVRSAINNLRMYSGGVVVERDGNRVIYHSAERWQEQQQAAQHKPVKSGGPYAMATPIQVGRGFRWWSGSV